MGEQMDQGLLEIPVLGEENSLIAPQALVVELGDLRQRVVATVVVIARVGSPGF
jgi:hypothetical protein